MKVFKFNNGLFCYGCPGMSEEHNKSYHEHDKGIFVEATWNDAGFRLIETAQSSDAKPN